MKRLIIFFSRSNNTRTAAQYLSSTINADLIEIVEETNRKGFIGFLKSGMEAVIGKKSNILGEPWTLIDPYSNLFIMTPIWGSHSTPAINSFLNNANLKGKEIIVITFQADREGRGSEKVYNHLSEIIEKKGGKFLKGIPLHSTAPGKYAGKDYLEQQIHNIKNLL